MCNAIVELKNIHMAYSTKNQRVDVLKDLNLSVKRNEYLVIMGKSGSGKSTILNVISGFIKPNNGEVLVDGIDIEALNEDKICGFRNKTIGYVFQSFNLIYQFTILENVMVPLLIAGMNKREAEEKAKDMLEKVGLQSRISHFPNELSGGEQQRVGIARALVNNPEIIIADEPTGNLDTQTGNEILDIFDDIHEMGKTIILVTHDSRVAERATRAVDIEELM